VNRISSICANIHILREVVQQPIGRPEDRQSEARSVSRLAAICNNRTHIIPAHSETPGCIDESTDQSIETTGDRIHTVSRKGSARYHEASKPSYTHIAISPIAWHVLSNMTPMMIQSITRAVNERLGLVVCGYSQTVYALTCGTTSP